jgi:hypothetical protein
MTEPYRFQNWTQAHRWCVRVQQYLDQHGVFSEGDVRVDHVEPIRVPGSHVCFFGFSGPGHATLRLAPSDLKEGLERFGEFRKAGNE